MELTEEQKLMQLGVYEGHKFQIEELSGRYYLDLNNKRIIDANNGIPVRGLYEHILDGTWHVK